MIRYLRASIHLLMVGTILFGVIYPCAVWVVAHLFFPWAAEGQTVTLHGRSVGLFSVGQTFTSPGYFWSRPSVIPLDAGPLLVSRGSNLSWSSPALRSSVEARMRLLGGGSLSGPFSIPEDMIMASGSGIDPEISLQAALFQIPRVAKKRGVSENELRALVFHLEESSFCGLFPRRVNVLQLNCALDHQYPLA